MTQWHMRYMQIMIESKFQMKLCFDKARKMDGQRLRCKMEKWNKAGNFDILNNTTENVTLVQLMDPFVNVNHAVSVVGKWILYSNDKNPCRWLLNNLI